MIPRTKPRTCRHSKTAGKIHLKSHCKDSLRLVLALKRFLTYLMDVFVTQERRK